MWEQYKKTFAKTQTVIAIVTSAIYLALGHGAAQAAVFFLVMQVGAVAGAMWGVRLRKKVDGQV